MARLSAGRRRAALALGVALLAVAAAGIGFVIADRYDQSRPAPKLAATAQSQKAAAAAPPESSAPPNRQQASVPRPPAAPQRRMEQPAWLRYAASAPMIVAGQPIIAIVIDDMGVDRMRSMRMVDLAAPLTLSYLPYARELESQTALARLRGHELMVHLPMEPVGHADPGPDALKTDLDRGELERRLADGLSKFGGYVGVNNHMGSKFTAWRPGMEVVMTELKKRGLLFLDSRTTSQSVGAELAAQMDVPHIKRNVFLDDVMLADNVGQQLAELERVARRQGYAVAIGHPHDSTIAALAAWIPTLKEKRLQLVPLTALVARQQGAASAGAPVAAMPGSVYPAAK